MKKSKIVVKFLSVVMILAVCVSLLVIPSFADTSSFDHPTPYYLDFHDVEFPSGYTAYLDVDFLVNVDDDLFVYDSIYVYSPAGYDSSLFVSFLNWTDPDSNPQAVVYDSTGGNTIIDDDYLYINIIGDTSPLVDTVLAKIGVKGFQAGTYVFNPSPLFFENRVVTVTTSDYFSNIDEGDRIVFSSLSVYGGVPAFTLALNGTYGYISSEGFTSGWDGRITFNQPFFISDLETSLLMRSCFSRYVPPSVSQDDLDQAFDNGYIAGQKDPDPNILIGVRQEGFQEGYRDGKDDGYQLGLNAADTDVFAENLLGDTLSKPFSELMKIHLFDTPNGTNFTIGTLFGTIVSLSLLLIFLKMFAGG